MAVNNFNLIAPFYDRLTEVVFGKSLTNIQLVHLNEIGKDDSVLILGGGTGEILESLPRCGKIVFLDKSEMMIQLAKERKFQGNVDFVTADFLAFETKARYDIIQCPFFLDCFNETNLQSVITKCKSLLQPNGKFIVIDFEADRSNLILLVLMHLFFKIFSNLESNSLKKIHNFIVSEGFETVDEKFLHRNRLFSRLYRNL